MRDSIRGVAVANEARMIRNAEPHVAIAIVEGPDDRTLFGKFFPREHCRIVVAHGRPHAFQALSILRKDSFRGILVIADADFERIICAYDSDPDVVLTDQHDAEMMMLCSPALDVLLGEYGNDTRISAFTAARGSVLEALLGCAQPIGCARLASVRNGLSLRFEGLKFDSFLCERTLVVDVDDAHRAIQEQSQVGVIARGVFDDPELLPPLVELCCGHDVVQVLATALRRLLGQNNPSEVHPFRLERSLRLAYEFAHFKLTQLFAQIIEWESRNAPFRVLRDDSMPRAS